ncbi:MAG: hypothetical protein B7Y45_09625 [Sphingomonas sp. 28-66-16]|nr:MAG: hypothetical protein B7Y45_09625 [Sphingomonas sp. 28-66-16]
MNISRLITDHDRIDRIVVGLASIVDSPVPAPAGASSKLAELAEALTEHLGHEDSFIYPAIIAGDKTVFSTAATDFVRQFEALRRDWDNYLHAWTSAGIALAWPDFCRETQAMMIRLAARVRAENELLYMTALQQGVITLKDIRAAA